MTIGSHEGDKMKQFFYSLLLIICLFFIAGCVKGQPSNASNEPSHEDTTNSIETNEVLETPSSENSMSDIPLTVLQADSRFHLQMTDDNNQTYHVHIYSSDEEKGEIDSPSFLGVEGEPFYSGQYHLYLSEDDADYGVKQEHLNLFESEGGSLQHFIEGEKMAYISSHKTGRDLLVIYQKEALNQKSLNVFALDDGELQEVRVDGQSLKSINGELRNIGDLYYQSVEYKNNDTEEEFGWFFTTWELNEETLTLSLKSQAVYNDESFIDGYTYGQETYEHWKHKPTSTFAYPYIPITSDWLDEVEKGRFPSVSFAVGTSLQEIFEQKGEPDAITDWLRGAETFMFNNIGYAVTTTSDNTVNTLLIPGTLIDGDIEQIYDKLGEPDEKVAGEQLSHTEVMIYNTGAHILYIEKSQNEIEMILVSKTETPEISTDWSGMAIDLNHTFVKQ